MKQISTIGSFFAFPTIVFLLHLIASKILDLYTIYPNLDIPFHFLGGFSIAFMSVQFLSYWEKEKIIPPLNMIMNMGFTISLTTTATVFWEFAEFILDQILNTNIQVSLANTMQDQFMGIMGGLAWMIVYLRKHTKTQTTPKRMEAEE